MIKKGDIVVCILKDCDWKPAVDVLNPVYPKYNEQCIIEDIYYSYEFKQHYVSIIGYDLDYALKSFRKIEDNFANEVLELVKLEIEIEKQESILYERYYGEE